MNQHRLDKITDAIENDFDVRQRVNVPSQARMTFEWAKIMQAILKLPVPRYVEPKPVSGEIVNAAQL